MVLTASLTLACRDGTRARTLEDIFQDRLKIDTLYLTDDGQQIVAPANPTGAVLVDAASGMLAWPAWQCNNPACPGRGAAGTPFLFPRTNPFIYVRDDGTIGVRQLETAADHEKMEDFSEPRCPACLKERNFTRQTPQQRRQHRDWCQVHVLPSAAARLRELEKEHQQFLARQQERQDSGDTNR